MALEQDRQIAEVVTREQSRLRRFIRRRVADPGSPSGKGWESWRCAAFSLADSAVTAAPASHRG